MSDDDFGIWADSMNESAAQRQIGLDFVYGIACKYDMERMDAMALCGAVGVNWDDLQKYTGKPAPINAGI